MDRCLECNCELDEDFDEFFYTSDGDGPFCEDCFDSVEEDRAQVGAVSLLRRTG